MQSGSYRAISVNAADGRYETRLEDLGIDQLPLGDTIIDVEYSGLNYKDALALTGKGKVLRTLPVTPGIDLAGRVAATSSATLAVGDRVLVTGWGVGEERSGGFAEKARIKSDWAMSIPDCWDARTAMVFGTAGLTAMLCIDALERHGIDREGEIVVTGAGGGVGGFAIAALARLGYRVAAVTGRPELGDYLQRQGASVIVSRSELTEVSRPLMKERWSAAIDVVGGQMLANILAATKYGGAVAACGLAGSADLPTTVMPFILRNVALLGIDSVRAAPAARERAWVRLATLFPNATGFDVSEVDLDGLAAVAERLLEGRVAGRTVVKVR